MSPCPPLIITRGFPLLINPFQGGVYLGGKLGKTIQGPSDLVGGGLLIRCCHYYIYIFTSTPQAWLRGWRQWRHWQRRQSCSKIQYTHGPHETRLHRTWWGGTRRAIYAVYRLDGGFSPRTPPKLWQLWPLRREYIYIYCTCIYK